MILFRVQTLTDDLGALELLEQADCEKMVELVRERWFGYLCTGGCDYTDPT